MTDHDPRVPVHLDPDPLQVAEHETVVDRQFRERNRAIRQLILAGLGLAIIILAILAAPRSAHVVPLGNKSDLPPSVTHAPFTVPPGSGIVVPAAEPLPSPATFELASAIEGGFAAYALPFHGRLYLALPEGPGVRVRICAGSGIVSCIIRTSTDAGPSLEMQRVGRLADLSFADFAKLCDCWPPAVGLLPIRVERDGPWVELPAIEP